MLLGNLAFAEVRSPSISQRQRLESILEGHDSDEKEDVYEQEDTEQGREENGEESPSEATATPREEEEEEEDEGVYDEDDSEPVIVPPYFKILTSVPFLSVMIAQIGNLWAQYTTNTLTPTYLKYVQGVPDNLVSDNRHTKVELSCVVLRFTNPSFLSLRHVCTYQYWISRN